MTPAMATRRFCPPERSKGDFSKSSSPRPTKAAASRTRSSTSSSFSFMFLGPKAISLYTVSSKSWYSGYWNRSPTRKRTCRVVSLVEWMSCPSKRTWPELGFSRPFRCWMKVLLPEPVWPMMAMNSPRSAEKSTFSTATRSKGVPSL